MCPPTRVKPLCIAAHVSAEGLSVHKHVLLCCHHGDEISKKTVIEDEIKMSELIVNENIKILLF